MTISPFSFLLFHHSSIVVALVVDESAERFDNLLLFMIICYLFVNFIYIPQLAVVSALIQVLKYSTPGQGKTVVTSVHQPSSRAYQMFDDLLVLSEERCIYFGKRSKAMGYFERIKFSPSFPMNPADFQLDFVEDKYHGVILFPDGIIYSKDSRGLCSITGNLWFSQARCLC
ncbi:uncharacterized protein [Henckelia pumila]|uniref:uncharacterized protein isoform X2 n=1 Tax=Henckelia pumila TaxID=405737 RepID=UPI003C6E9CE5